MSAVKPANYAKVKDRQLQNALYLTVKGNPRRQFQEETYQLMKVPKRRRKKNIRKPDEGNPHVRFDEGGAGKVKRRVRGPLMIFQSTVSHYILQSIKKK
ncbi:hypothetical protein [Paenibacillus sp. Y412MC10]|uniref:hypothetical protein n=1 Tax=Geobacillus sp. (strain Y412MC10) TaxID=481743 RepID=UPI0011AB67F0|nr:hypothetical protein [Paenibacillus sp. Y412MC10]